MRQVARRRFEAELERRKESEQGTRSGHSFGSVPLLLGSLPFLAAERACYFAINAFEGSVSSSSFRAVSTPATGNSFASSRPTCTSTLAWSQ